MSAEIVEEKVATPATAKPKSKMKLIVIGGVAAVTLLGGGGTAYALLAGGMSAEATAKAARDAKELKEHVPGMHGEGAERDDDKFVDVPSMVVNLRSPDGAVRFLKLHFILVPGPNGDPETLKNKLPLILDAYQPFLRELRPEDLAGSAAIFRVKEEMMIRANDTLGAGSVSDILIEDLVQQ